MRTLRLCSICILAFALSVIVGCKPPEQHMTETPTPPEYNKQLPPGRLALRKITNPADIPDFTQGGMNLLGLRQSVQNRQRPRSMRAVWSMMMAWVGQASAHWRQPCGHLAASMIGRPR